MRRYEFNLKGVEFCVQDIDGLCNCLGVDADSAAIFCRWASSLRADLPWNSMRRLYGIGPAVPSIGSLKDDDYTPSSMDDVAHRFDCPAEHIISEIDKLKQRWLHEMEASPDEFQKFKPSQRKRSRPKAEDDPGPPPAPPLPVPVSDRVADAEMVKIEAVIVSFGFTMAIFNLAQREESHMRIEARWFAGRLVELQKLFDEVSTKSLARQAMINEMHMRRIDEEMARLPPLNAKFWQYQDAKIKLEEIYSSQWSQIEKLNPALRSQQTKRTFAGVVSEIVEGIREFQSDPNNEIADGVFTALELQVEMRSSKQQGGDVQYRPDIVAAINESRRAIWDPKFKRRLEDKHLRIIGFAFHEAVKAFTEKTGIQVPDLASESGEHPELYIPSPEESSAASLTVEDAPIVLPEQSVQIS